MSILKKKPKSQHKSVWESGLDEIPEVESCSEVERPKIRLTLTVLKKIHLLMQEYEHLEWAADLIGFNDEEKNEITIADIEVFKQDVDYASVIRTDFKDSENLIGVIHSHHSMGNTFSHIDDEFVNSNHDLSAVVSFADNVMGVDINFTYRAKTNCGKFVRHNDLSWVLDYVFEEFDEEEFISEAKKQINERVGKMSLDGYFDLIDYEFPGILEHPKFRRETSAKLLADNSSLEEAEFSLEEELARLDAEDDYYFGRL